MIKHTFGLLAALLICCSTGFGQKITIQGNILNSADPNVIVNVPVDGKYFAGANLEYTIEPSTGKFQFEIGNSTSGFVTLKNNWKTIKLFVVPGQSYSIQWDMNSRPGIKITGHESEGQMMLQELSLGQNAKHPSSLLDLFRTVKGRLSIANQLANEKNAVVKSYFNQKKISTAFYQSTLNLIEVDRINMLSTNFFFEYRKWEKRNEEDIPRMAVFFEEFMPVWKKLFKKINSSYEWLESNQYTDLLGRYTYYLNLIDSGRLVFGQGNYAKNYIDQIQPILEGKMLEYSWANLIVVGVDQKKYEKEWIQEFEDFKSSFPKSALMPFLELTVQKVVDYQTNLASEQSPEVEFIKNYEQINELSELLAVIKGKVTYIDLWATWCVPCREELKYSVAMHQDIEKLGVQTLYISLDNDKAHDAWDKMVYGLGLKGYNMRANPTFHEDLNSRIPNFHGIPRYLIVDKEGKVAVWDAKRPSDQLDLIKQLKEYL